MGGLAAPAFICFGLVMLAAIIMLACSFATVPVNFAALKYSTLHKSYFDDTVYRPGRYFVGLGNTMVEFPMTWQKLSFCKGCTDGPPVSGKAAKAGTNPVSVYLSMHLFYKIRIAHLPKLIAKYPNRDWHGRYVAIAKDAVLEYLYNNIQVDDLLENRTDVARRFGMVISEKLQSVYGFVQAIYIGHVTLETSSDRAYLIQWIAQRSKLTSTKQGIKEEIAEETKSIVASIQAETDTLLSQQYLWGNSTIAQETARGEKEVIQARGKSYAQLKTSLGFTYDELLRYVFYDKVKTDASSIVAGFNAQTKMMSTLR